MYAVNRSYPGRGATELFDLLAQREDEIKKIFTSVPGFVSYTAFRNRESGMTTTVCQDKAGADETSRRAAAWVKENVKATVDPPDITEGDAVLHF